MTADDGASQDTSSGRAVSSRERRRMWRACRRLVDDLRLPDPFDAAEFVRGVAARRGRPIELLAVHARPDLPCGLLLTTEAADYLMYAADTTPFHQQHILLHEAAHLICGHQDKASLRAAAQILLPNLHPSLVQRVLGRTVYSEPQEREAELVASLILSRVSSPRPYDGDGAAQTAVAPLFGLPDGRPQQGS
ncbi:ParH-like protein [Streptomyces sp. NPDC058653]|uniref:ParH-like protein n=1 Tax=Streptomyces sp. NPDC058653 TaxID=3346576 RepID=UPI00365EE8E4